MSSRVQGFLRAILLIALLIALFQLLTTPVAIEANEGVASMHFLVNMPVGNCVPVKWDVEHISAVYLNNMGRIGQGTDMACGGLPTFTVTLVDGTSRIYGPDQVLAVRYKALLELIAVILLLVTMKRQAVIFGMVSLLAVASILVPRGVLEQIVPFINDGFNSALAVFSIADKFSLLFPFACLVAALYWLVIPVWARQYFLLAASFVALPILGASLEFVLLVVVLILVAYTISLKRQSADSADSQESVGQTAAVFYLLLVEIVVLLSAIWGSIWTSLSSPVVVGGLFLSTIPILIATIRRLPSVSALPAQSIQRPALATVLFAVLSLGLVFYYVPSKSSIPYLPIVDLVYFGTLVFFALRILGSMPTFGYRRVLGYASIAAILLAFVVGKWPNLQTDLLGWIGFSYLAFRLLHVILDSLNGRVADASLLEMFIYALFYPALLVGPIDRLPRFLKDLRDKDRQFDWKFIVVGLTRIAIGAAKKFFIADILLAPLALGISLPLPYNAPNAWSQVLAYSFYILFDFSGYIDIVLGMGYLLGFSLPENFDSPYTQVNITRFWQAWHITLSNWLRTYIFLPLSGRLLRSGLRKHPNVVVFIGQMTTMLLIGLWHGITMNFVMWGLWHGMGLFLHKIYSDRTKPYLPRLADYPMLHSLYTLAGWALTFIFVSLGWVFFALPDLAASGQVFRTLFNVR